jgi:hypothetical protein
VRIRTDDEVYRVDAVWLGPPKATFPWRARYVAWGIGMPVFLLTLTVEQKAGFHFSFFSVAWAVLITIAVTRLIGKRISHERPLGAVTAMWSRELRSPREITEGRGYAAGAARIRVSPTRPQPKLSRRARKAELAAAYRADPAVGRRPPARAAVPGSRTAGSALPAGAVPGPSQPDRTAGSGRPRKVSRAANRRARKEIRSVPAA